LGKATCGREGELKEGVFAGRLEGPQLPWIDKKISLTTPQKEGKRRRTERGQAPAKKKSSE